MKRLVLFPAFLFLFTHFVFSQTNQFLNYQAIVRDGNGNPILNQSVAFQICLLKGNAAGMVSYCETHDASTNEFGLVSLQIGNGSASFGEFDTINWGHDNYYLKVSLDETGGNNYTWMGTTQIQSVPYALYADSSGKGDNLGNHVANQNIQSNGHWISKNGNNSGIKIIDSTDYGVSIQSLNSAKTLFAISNNSSDSALAIYGQHTNGNFGFIGNKYFGSYAKHTGSGNYGYIGSDTVGVYGYANVYTSMAVYGENESGCSGYLGGDFGVYGSSDDTYAFLGGINTAIYGCNKISNMWGRIGSNYGVTGASENQHTWGYLGGENGAYGVNTANGNRGYFGGTSYGAYAIHESSGNIGYIGSNNYGSYGRHGTSSNYGCLGTSDAGVGGFAYQEGYGVYGKNVETGNYGVLGHLSYGVYGVSSNGYAGYFEGKGFFDNWLGIGIAPQSMLDVEGEGTPNGGVPNYNEVIARFRNNLAEHHTALALDAQDGNDALLYFSENGVARWDIRTDVSEDEFILTDNVLEFRYQKNGANAEVLKLYSDGTHYKIKTYGDLIPSTANYYDCGTSGAYWNQVYSNYFVDITDKDTYKTTQSLPYGLKEILGIETLMLVNEDGKNDFSIDPKSLENQISGLVVKPENDGGNAGIRINELIPILIKAIQEQQAQIEALKGKTKAMEK